MTKIFYHKDLTDEQWGTLAGFTATLWKLE